MKDSPPEYSIYANKATLSCQKRFVAMTTKMVRIFHCAYAIHRTKALHADFVVFSTPV